MSDLNEKFNEIMDTPDTTGEFDMQDINSSKVFAVLACIPFIFWLPIVACPTSKYGRFWADQGLSITILDIIIWVLGVLLGHIPVIGRIINAVAYIIISIFFIIGIIYALGGKAKELPIIGGFIKVFRK